MVRQTVPALYALGDTRTPVVVSALDLCAFVALAEGLRGPLGHVGISVAVAGSSAVQMVLLLAGLRWRLGTIHSTQIGLSMSRTLAASLVAAFCGWAATRLVGGSLAGILGMGAFTATFLLAAWGFRSPELREIARAVGRRLGYSR
jgi:putative peptidoglycan lipid II flippase